MRIASKSYLDVLQQGILKAESKLGLLSEQITSGKRINRPSDDPVGASQALRTHATLEITLSQQRTLERARQINGFLDKTLGEMATPLQTAYNAALKATQPGLGDAGRLAAAKEIRAVLSRLVTIGNTDFNGIYLLSGTQNDKPALLETGIPGNLIQFQGNEQPMKIAIAPGREMEITITGQELFNFENSVGTRSVSAVDDDLFGVIEDLAQDVEIGYMDGIHEHMEQLKALQEHVLTERGKIGTYGLRLEQNLELAKDTEFQSRRLLSDIEDVDIAAALMEIERQKLSYQAALAATAKIANMPNLFEWL